MIVGQTTKEEDVEINVCKEKNLTNHRKKGHQGITQMAPEENYSLEECIDFLEKDELLEITPLSLRLRKKFLSDIDRKRNRRSTENS
jgi:GTP-binding protein